MAETMIQQLMHDEDKFMKHASAHDFTRAAVQFRNLARQANTPQEREFYADRAYQFSVRAAHA